MGKWTGILALLAMVAAAGCTTKLDTGYEPVKLGTMTPTERRGLYAQDFSPEAQAAQADQQSNKNSGADFGSHMPGGEP
ncbi:MAG TPA: hypothetical protein VL992_03150 [Tepidisphaeraceae bacterium]|nr:hypothetical protein [Tepidisphaeraceae bacterium]